MALLPLASLASTAGVSESPLSANHYLIPGFSNHLLIYGRVIYGDLEEAKVAVRAHHTLALRLALADASGHLLQLATPPSLAPLRQQMVAVRQALSSAGTSHPDAAWKALIARIKRLPMHRADQAARLRLLRTAEEGRKLAQQGNLVGARNDLSRLVSEIEITSHVFPITSVRKNVSAAVDAASAFTPKWAKAKRAIKRAVRQTRWLINPEASRMIHAFDEIVAAYVQLPDSPARSHLDLQHAVWWLHFDHADHDGDKDNSLLQAIRLAAGPRSKLTLKLIGHLQTHMADNIRQERLASGAG